VGARTFAGRRNDALFCRLPLFSLHRAVDRPDDLAVLDQVRVGAVPHPDAGVLVWPSPRRSSYRRRSRITYACPCGTPDRDFEGWVTCHAVDELKGNTPMAFTGYLSRYLERVTGASSRPE
jgi:hypothetical protein